MVGLGQPVFDVGEKATPVKGMSSESSGWTLAILGKVGELDSVIGEHGMDAIGDGRDQRLQKGGGSSHVSPFDKREKGGNEPDIAAFHAAVDKAIRRRGFVDYSKMPAYARGIETVVDSLESLLKRGPANVVRELVERALQRLESAMNDLDDSDGFMGEILDRLQKLHLDACKVAKPDPAALAKFLFEWEVSSGWEVFLGAAEDYADVLGKAGLAEYRNLAEAKWAKIPPLLLGKKEPEYSLNRWRITHIMETLANPSAIPHSYIMSNSGSRSPHRIIVAY